jgi:radical SAM superfamily enzyme YgiQ (UPF0313 family)
VNEDPCFLSFYEEVAPRLTGGGIWLRGGELNTLPPGERDRRPFRVLFARLSSYLDCGASFTHPLLYQLAASLDGIYPDLAYLPPPADRAAFAARGVPWLLGTQSKRGPLGFDLVGLSLSLVQELLNLPTILARSGIPLGRSERLRRPELPLVILGGASAPFSSVAWGEEAWIDAVFVGEDDRAIRALLETCRDAKQRGLAKLDLLAELARLPGVLLPEGSGPVRRAARAALDGSPHLGRAPVLYHEDAIAAGHLQLSEGCPCFCAFCAESWDRKPYRERSVSRLLEAAHELRRAQAVEQLELSSASFNAYRGLRPLLAGLVPHFARLRLKSQRLDLLAEDPALLELEAALGKTSVTCGVEGISARLRRYLHKSLDDAALVAALEGIFGSLRPRELKLFLIATGLEEEPDLDELDALLGRLRALRERQRGGARIIISVTPLVRYPFTPLEFEDAPDVDRHEPTLRRIATMARARGLEFRAAAELSETFVCQVLARAADPRIGQALLRALDETGFVYQRQVSRAFARRFRASLETAGLTSTEVLRGHGPDAWKPWTRIEVGVERAFLGEEIERLRRGEDEGYCLARARERARCLRCGACAPAEVASLTGERPLPWPGGVPLAARIASAREAERPLRLLVHAGPAARGLPRKLLSVALVRALLAERPALGASFRRHAGSRSGAAGEPVWLEGAEVLTLHFHADAIAEVAAAAESEALRAAVDRELGDWGRWLGLAREDWAPERIEIRSPFPPALEPFLRRNGLKAERRRTERGYALELTPAARRKGILRALRWERAGGETRMEVSPGPKLDPEALLREGFELTDARDWIRSRATLF